MTVIAVGGFQHETNTFAPSKADFAAFAQGGAWPPLTEGDAIAPRLAGANTKQYFLFFLAAAVLYLAITLVSNLVFRQLERRVRRGQRVTA